MIKLFSVLFFLLIGTSVWADCGYDLKSNNITYTVSEINPTISSDLVLSRKKDNGLKCTSYFIAFSKGQSGTYSRRAVHSEGGDFISYNVYKSNNSTGVLKDVGDISSTGEVLAGNINKDETASLSYYFTMGAISADSPPKSGTYTDILKLQAYSGAFNNIFSYETTRDLYININVPKFISLSLVESGGTFNESSTSRTLDFGELEENEDMNFDVRVVSNAGYILKISSNNNGLLKRIGRSGSSSEIAYDLYAFGNKKSLSSSAASPEIIASQNGKTLPGGAQVPIKVVIKSVTDKDPGTYQDYLTLSVISNE